MPQTTAREALKAGLVVGSLDIGAAFLQYYLKTGRNPLGILPFIASGVFGKKAFTGGTEMMVLGLLFHYLIATTWAFIFYYMIIRLPLFRRSWIATGIIYGLLVWCVMNLVVVPLSNTPSRTFTLSGTLIGMGILVCCIGLPLAFMALRPGRFLQHQPVS
jgi:hypothetical protein